MESNDCIYSQRGKFRTTNSFLLEQVWLKYLLSVIIRILSEFYTFAMTFSNIVGIQVR